MIRILLANHQPIIRSGLRLLLEHEPDFRVVAEAANGHEAVILAEFKRPDIVLLETSLPYVNGIAVARKLCSKEGCAKPVFVTADTDKGYVTEAFKAGAKGYVAGDSAPSDLPRAIHVVASGRLFLSSTICMQILDRHMRAKVITHYQKELFCLMVAGYNEREIAAHLHVEVNKLRDDCVSVYNVFPWDALPDAIAKSIRESTHFEVPKDSKRL